MTRPSDRTTNRSMNRSMNRSNPILLAALAAILTACASAPATRNAQLLTAPADSCAGARADAAADPRLDVHRVPAPRKMEPAPIRRPVPASALNKDGSSVIRVEVLVDTLGRPDMKTFAVIESSNPWFTTGARNAIAKWSFEPALLNGCKVARYYRFSATSAPRARRG